VTFLRLIIENVLSELFFKLECHVNDIFIIIVECTVDRNVSRYFINLVHIYFERFASNITW